VEAESCRARRSCFARENNGRAVPGLGCGIVPVGPWLVPAANLGMDFGATLIAINLAGDLFNLVFRHELLKGFVGVAVAGLLLLYMNRRNVRAYFSVK
jgi:hypothetical protein